MGALISCCRDDDAVETDPLREPLEPAQPSGPCRQYRVNTKASAFGDCLCGWPKADHDADAFADRGSALSARSPSRGDTTWMQPQRKIVAICEAYRPNTRAAFGECVCGRPRAEHSEAALLASTGGSRSAVSSLDFSWPQEDGEAARELEASSADLTTSAGTSTTSTSTTSTSTTAASAPTSTSTPIGATGSCGDGTSIDQPDGTSIDQPDDTPYDDQLHDDQPATDCDDKLGASAASCACGGHRPAVTDTL